MDYEKKYKEALERASKICNSDFEPYDKSILCSIIFPELKESEDDRMRKNLYKCLRYYVPNDIAEEYIKWLEKQGDKDKNTESQLQPKFKVRDWIVDDKTPNDVFYVIEVLEEIYKVIDIDGDDYHIPHCKADMQFHLWTIDDAKKGDILVVDGTWIVEFDKKMTDGCTWKDTSILTSFEYDMDDDTCTTGSHMFYEDIWPASKKDIDLFKKKRNEHLASNSHDESKFKVGDKVTIEGDDTIYTIDSIEHESCWLTHEDRGLGGWATFGVLKHYVE